MRERNYFWGPVTIIVILCVTGVIGARKKSKFKPIAVVENIRACPQNELELYVNYTMPAKDDYRINLAFVVKSPVSEGAFINSFAKCESPTSVQCEQFLTIPINDWCTFLTKQKDPIYQQIMDDFEPPLLCPFMGSYVLRNKNIGEIVEMLVKKASVDVKNDHNYYRWTSRIQDNVKKTDIFCLEIVASLKQVKAT